MREMLRYARNNELEDVHAPKSSDHRVPWIKHVTDSCVWSVILGGGGESCTPTYGKCQIMAITLNLGNQT
jgi:hypothetical protein